MAAQCIFKEREEARIARVLECPLRLFPHTETLGPLHVVSFAHFHKPSCAALHAFLASILMSCPHLWLSPPWKDILKK